MKKNCWLIISGLIALLLPIIFRIFWFYQGFPEKKTIETPDYASIKVPVISTSTPQTKLLPLLGSKAVVLFDMTHTNWYTPGEIEPFITRLQNSGATVKWSAFENDFLEELNRASTYVVINPTVAFYESELSAIASFVQQGGKLIVITDPTRNELYYSDYASNSFLSVDVANQLLLPYNISFNDDYAYNLLNNEGNFRNIYIIPESESELVDQINKMVFYSAHTINTDSKVLLASSKETLSSLSDTGGNLVFATLDDQYPVLAISDFTFLTSSGYSIADNQQFLSNLSVYSASNEKIYSALQFPTMLQGDLAIYLSTDLNKDSEMISAVSNLQHNSLKASSGVHFVDSLDIPGDKIILGLLPPSGEIADLIEPFNIEFSTIEQYNLDPSSTPFTTNEPFDPTPTPYDEEWNDWYDWDYPSDTITIPGFGEISLSGTGLILFAQSGGQYTFILLGNSQSEVIQLLDTLSYRDFSSCLEYAGITVCPVYGDLEY